VELVRIGNMEELSELGKEIDGEAQQSCSLLEGGEGHQRGGYHLPPSKDDGPYGLHGLAVIVCLRPAVDSGGGGEERAGRVWRDQGGVGNVKF
jgi:hypothetical protein